MTTTNEDAVAAISRGEMPEVSSREVYVTHLRPLFLAQQSHWTSQHATARAAFVAETIETLDEQFDVKAEEGIPRVYLVGHTSPTLSAMQAMLVDQGREEYLREIKAASSAGMSPGDAFVGLLWNFREDCWDDPLTTVLRHRDVPLAHVVLTFTMIRCPAGVLADSGWERVDDSLVVAATAELDVRTAIATIRLHDLCAVIARLRSHADVAVRNVAMLLEVVARERYALAMVRALGTADPASIVEAASDGDS